MSELYYNVGGLVFRMEVDQYWEEMPYTEAVRDRIRKASVGLPINIDPVRAGDKVPPRTYVTDKSELPEGYSRKMLDFSQYEPFRTSPCGNPVFSLTVSHPDNEPINGVERKLIVEVKDAEQGYNVYSVSGTVSGTLFEFLGSDGSVAVRFLISSDFTKSTLWPVQGVGPYALIFYLSMAARIAYSCTAPFYGRLLLHSSVISHNSKALMFLGASGTGKSTHSRIWLDNVPGTELLNDDNPVICLSDGILYVYGTPWSGKTPCYRNVKSPVQAIVRLSQAYENRIAPVSGLEAYALFIGSVSCARWERSVMDKVTSLLSDIVSSVSFFALGCRPDAEAVSVCRSATEQI